MEAVDWYLFSRGERCSEIGVVCRDFPYQVCLNIREGEVSAGVSFAEANDRVGDEDH